MRKTLFLLLVVTMLLIPEDLHAGLRTYNLVELPISVDTDLPSPTPPPHRPQMFTINPIIMEIDEGSGDLHILFNMSIDNANIIITHNGARIEENNISIICEQYIIYNMSCYEEGQYILTIESEGSILSQYEINIYEK